MYLGTSPWTEDKTHQKNMFISSIRGVRKFRNEFNFLGKSEKQEFRETQYVQVAFVKICRADFCECNGNNIRPLLEGLKLSKTGNGEAYFSIIGKDISRGYGYLKFRNFFLDNPNQAFFWNSETYVYNFDKIPQKLFVYLCKQIA